MVVVCNLLSPGKQGQLKVITDQFLLAALFNDFGSTYMM
jgi:hypothetical protein